MAAPFDPSQYAAPPRLSASNALPLVRRLLLVTPKGAPESVRLPARAMRQQAEELRGARLARRKRSRPVDKRLVDQFADASLGRLYRRISDYAALPEERHALAGRASELLALLFPDGLDFLSAKMDVQWNVTDEMLRTIDEEDLQGDLDRIAGAEFLAEVRLAHAEYGRALGITAADAAPKSDGASVTDLLQKLAATMGEYTLQLAALASSSATPAELREASRRALAPVDDFRKRAARKPDGGADAEEPDEGDEPLPPAPDA